MSQTIAKIEASIESLKENIKKAERLKCLMDNAEFKEFILEGFMGEKRLQDLVTKRIHASFQDPANKLYVDSQITAIGALRMFMLLTEQEGKIAQDELINAEEEYSRALEEDVA